MSGARGDGAPGADPIRPWWRADWLCALLLAAGVGLAYWRVWHAGFIWDDDAHVWRNPCIVGPLGFGAIWTSSKAVYYPLVLTSFWLQHLAWGLNPVPYHLVNVALHAACAILMWRVLRRLGVPGAWLGAAIWALHPVQVESAAWITEQKNTQSCFFYLLAILFFIRWREAAPGRRAGAYGFALLCGILAILSKSSTVMLPVILGLCWWWMDRRWRWRNAVWLVPFAAVSLVASLWTIWEQSHTDRAIGAAWSQTMPERLAISGGDFWFYLGKLAWPHPLIFIYPRWDTDASGTAAFLPFVAMAALLVFLWVRRNGPLRPVFFAAAYFVVSLFPVLGFFNVYFYRYSFVGDHFQYLASMGPLTLAAAGIWIGFDRLKLGAPARLWCCSIALLALGALTSWQCGMYEDIETLWKTTLALNPACWMARNNLGRLYFQRGRIDDAIAQYRAGLQASSQADGWNNLGEALAAEGRPADALAAYSTALRLDPNCVDAVYNVGVLDSQAGQIDQAVADYLIALKLDPLNAPAHRSLADALAGEGRIDEAVAHYREALRIDPAYAAAHSNLGNLLLQQGDTAQAIEEFRAALTSNPGLTFAHYNLANALRRAGRMDAAVAEYLEAIRCDPKYAETYNNLGCLLAQQGRVDYAIAEYHDALRAKPDFPEALCNLGTALIRRGDEAEAIDATRKALALQPANPAIQNDLAWLLATVTRPELRDAPEAVRLATQASGAGGGNNPSYLRTLAAAHAQAGQFPDAIQAAQKALQGAQSQGNAALASDLRREISLYEAAEPYRE